MPEGRAMVIVLNRVINVFTAWQRFTFLETFLPEINTIFTHMQHIQKRYKSADGCEVLQFILCILPLQQHPVHLTQFGIFSALCIVLGLQLVEFLRLSEQFLVEAEEGLLQDAVLLCLGECRFLEGRDLLYDLTAVLLLLVQDLHGQLAVVVQFLQEVLHLPLAEMGVLQHECLQVVLQQTGVVGVGECGLGGEEEVGGESAACEQALGGLVGHYYYCLSGWELSIQATRHMHKSVGNPQSSYKSHTHPPLPFLSHTHQASEAIEREWMGAQYTYGVICEDDG